MSERDPDEDGERVEGDAGEEWGDEEVEEEWGDEEVEEEWGDEEAEYQNRDESPDEQRGDIPLSGLREDIEERRRKRSESTPTVAEAFEEADTEPVIDGEKVWADLLASHDEEAGVLAFGEAVEGEAENVRVIPNRICHNCKYFGDPPELHCTHEGTEIRRVADMDHYEVVDCPVVKNRSDLRSD